MLRPAAQAESPQDATPAFGAAIVPVELAPGVTAEIFGAAPSAGATGPTEELTEPGTDVILEPGDAIFYETDVVHTARGAGDEPTIVLGTLVLAEGQPLLMPVGMDMSATPTT